MKIIVLLLIIFPVGDSASIARSDQPVTDDCEENMILMQNYRRPNFMGPTGEPCGNDLPIYEHGL